MSFNNSELDFDEVNNLDHSTERKETVGQEGNSSSNISPEGEHITVIEVVESEQITKAIHSQ